MSLLQLGLRPLHKFSSGSKKLIFTRKELIVLLMIMIFKLESLGEGSFSSFVSFGAYSLQVNLLCWRNRNHFRLI